MLVMRLIDIQLAIPGILLAIAIIAILGIGLDNPVIAVGIFSVPAFARITRGSVLFVKESDYVHATRSLGASSFRIVVRHILPNCVAPLIVQSTLRVATAILTASSLSFLGLGVQPPTPEWGAMLSGARSHLQSSPHVAIVPGVAIILVVLGFNLFGDGLRDALDPRHGHRA